MSRIVARSDYRERLVWSRILLESQGDLTFMQRIQRVRLLEMSSKHVEAIVCRKWDNRLVCIWTVRSGKAYSQQRQAVKEAVLDYAKLTCRSIPAKGLVTPQLVTLALAGHAIYVHTAC